MALQWKVCPAWNGVYCAVWELLDQLSAGSQDPRASSHTLCCSHNFKTNTTSRITPLWHPWFGLCHMARVRTERESLLAQLHTHINERETKKRMSVNIKLCASVRHSRWHVCGLSKRIIKPHYRLEKKKDRSKSLHIVILLFLWRLFHFFHSYSCLLRCVV